MNDIGNDTKMQLNTILNNLKSRTFSNSNNSYNEDFINSKVKNLDINVFRSFGINDNNNIEPKQNKEIKDIKQMPFQNEKDINKNLYNLSEQNSIIQENNNYNDNEFNDNNISYGNNYSLNYSDIKNIIRNEFAELITPYQKQTYNMNF